MIKQGLQAFSGKRVLLLQGPAGPFFARMARELRHTGAQVFKVNFNAGDWLFYPRGAFNYRGTMEEWPFWFESLIRRLQIDTILLFGDCRPIHRVARAIASQHGLEIGVFEEGYVRPDHITLERFGVNGYSQHPRNPEHYADQPADGPKAQPVGRTYWAMARYVFWYFAIGSLGKPFFRHYRHHRPLTLLEGLPWIRAAWRKQWYRWAERGVQEQLTGQWDQRYFLVPLQVFNDSQITAHAGFDSINHFIETVLRSFAQHAPAETILVFKHHPMARGHRDYAPLIRKLAREKAVSASLTNRLSNWSAGPVTVETPCMDERRTSVTLPSAPSTTWPLTRVWLPSQRPSSRLSSSTDRPVWAIWTEMASLLSRIRLLARNEVRLVTSRMALISETNRSAAASPVRPRAA